MRVIDKINEVHLIIQRDVVAKTLAANGDEHAATRRERETLAKLESGGVRVGGDQALLELPFSSVVAREGKTRQYLHFETPVGGVNYFPYAKTRPFITIGH